MEWFKFYGGEYLSDPKMMALTATERSCWITLLSFASVAEDGGRIKYLSEAQLMTASNVSPMHEEWDATVGVLNKFVSLGMIDIDSNAVITIKNWQKRQETYLTNAERQKRYREKLKSNATVTTPLQQSNARIEKNRIEKTPAKAHAEFSIEEENENKTPNGGKRVLEGYKSMVKWAEVRRGFPFLSGSLTKQYTSLKEAKENKLTSIQLKERWEEFENDDFWSKKGFDWMDVVKSFNKRA